MCQQGPLKRCSCSWDVCRAFAQLCALAPPQGLYAAHVVLQAAATRALQRLHDIPDLKDVLAASTASSMSLEASMSPSHSSQLNSSTAAPVAAAAITAATAGSQQGPSMQAAAVPQPALAVLRSPVQTAHASTNLPPPAGGPAAASPPPPALCFAGGSEPEDLKQLAQVLASGNSRWLREKAAAAVEQLATDNPVACRCVCFCVCVLRLGCLMGSW